MTIQNPSTEKSRKSAPLAKQRSYGDIVAYLNDRWQKPTRDEATLVRMKQLDKALGGIANKTHAIIIAGTNGKSLTAHFTSKLLRSEGLNVGTFYAPHILTYNERIMLNEEAVANKAFTDCGNLVIDAAEELRLDCHSQELLTMMALLFFKENNVDVVVLESDAGGRFNPVNICTPKVVAVTRTTAEDVKTTPEVLKENIYEYLGIVHPGTHVVAGDQVKTSLQMMEELTTQQGGHWEMPIRKLAPLGYPFEQLHGRCGALAERIAQIFMNEDWAKGQDVSQVKDSLLVRKKGQRGRPTIEATRQAKLNPKRTMDQFWKETTNTLHARFQLLDKEKPTILLDNADNLDALENLFLGIRLMHYQKPIKGLVIIVGAGKDALNNEDFRMAIRYFFKKTPGQVFVCPLPSEATPGTHDLQGWNAEQVANDIKAKKVKAQAFDSFAGAFEAAKATVDEKYGLVVVTGSNSIISEYWQQRGIKRIG